MSAQSPTLRLHQLGLSILVGAGLLPLTAASAQFTADARATAAYEGSAGPIRQSRRPLRIRRDPFRQFTLIPRTSPSRAPLLPPNLGAPVPFPPNPSSSDPEKDFSISRDRLELLGVANAGRPWALISVNGIPHVVALHQSISGHRVMLIRFDAVRFTDGSVLTIGGLP